MRVLIPCDTDPKGISGGLTFLRNFKKGLEQAGQWSVKEGEADVCLIPGATMITRETFYDIKKRMPIILRIDGIPEDWRNRGTGTTRLKEFAKEADAVVYQSHFSRDYLGLLLKRDGGVIYNGVDFSIFNPTGKEAILSKGEPRILHVMWRQDPNKRPEEVIHLFRAINLINPKALLVLVGRYPEGWANYNFGFFNNEKFIHIENAKDEELAKIMRACDTLWFPSYADTCPNTVAEALACGLKVDHINQVGGVKELVARGLPDSIKEMAEQYVALFEMILREGVKVEA